MEPDIIFEDKVQEWFNDRIWESEGYPNIVKYGIGFCKKRCRVVKGE